MIFSNITNAPYNITLARESYSLNVYKSSFRSPKGPGLISLEVVGNADSYNACVSLQKFGVSYKTGLI